MSVAVSCNLAGGVILGVDSASTISNEQGQIVKTYEDAEKLFQLGERLIGIAVYGIANLGARSIGSYIREFEIEDPDGVISNKDSTVQEIVEQLRKFFLRVYEKEVVPRLEVKFKKKLDSLAPNQIPILGLAVGGFSGKAYLSEVWEVLIPIQRDENGAKLLREQGNFGSNWFALNEPIFRYFKGYDRQLMENVKKFFLTLLDRSLQQGEEEKLEKILGVTEYQVPFVAMPVAEGIKLVRFLVNMVINHHRFALGAPIVGGKAQIGLVTYKEDRFRILDERETL